MVLASINDHVGRKKVDPLKDRLNKIERVEILNALKECNWVKERAARRLGITERMIGYKIKNMG